METIERSEEEEKEWEGKRESVCYNILDHLSNKEQKIGYIVENCSSWLQNWNNQNLSLFFRALFWEINALYWHRPCATWDCKKFNWKRDWIVIWNFYGGSINLYTINFIWCTHTNPTQTWRHTFTHTHTDSTNKEHVRSSYCLRNFCARLLVFIYEYNL